jgi:hypothetical protein
VRYPCKGPKSARHSAASCKKGLAPPPPGIPWWNHPAGPRRIPQNKFQCPPMVAVQRSYKTYRRASLGGLRGTGLYPQMTGVTSHTEVYPQNDGSSEKLQSVTRRRPARRGWRSRPSRRTGTPASPACRFRVQGSGFRVQGSGFRVQSSGCRVLGSGIWVYLEGGSMIGDPKDNSETWGRRWGLSPTAVDAWRGSVNSTSRTPATDLGTPLWRG